MTAALFGKTKTKVMALLFCHSDQSYYLRQIIRAVGAGPGAVNREMVRLVRSGLVASHRRGRQTFYQANARSPIFQELRSIMVKSAGIADVIREALAPFAAAIDVAWIFGSFAKGEEVAESDVDLLILGEVDVRRVTSALSAKHDVLQREINPVIYSREEFRRRAKERNHFALSVLREPKIFLIGDETNLAGLGEERLAR